MKAYVPDPRVCAARRRCFAVGSVAASSRDRSQALQPRQARLLRVRDPADPAARRRRPFPVKYYITAMLFIVFDIEIIFLFPWAVYFDQMKVFGLRRDGAVHRHRLRGLRLCLAPRRPRVGLTTVDDCEAMTWVSRRSSRRGCC